MNKEYFFISGLPRSGSTLLTAILNQNPDFHSDISSVLQSIVIDTIQKLSYHPSSSNITKEIRLNTIKSIVDGFYKHIDKRVVFDTSRQWTKFTPLLKELYPYTKVICCVRDIKWVLDSFEKQRNKNSLYMSTIYPPEYQDNIYSRCDYLMDINKGAQIARPLLNIKEGLAANPKMMLLVDYELLTKSPEESLKLIYKFLDKPYYNHDYNNLSYVNNQYDSILGAPNIHSVNKKVEFKERACILPDDIISKYQNLEFWKQ